MADLITLQEYRDATRYTSVDAVYDTQVTAALKYASAAIRNYTARDFGAAQVTQDRSYPYDGCGYLDIDDADTINTVTLTVQGWADQVIDPKLYLPLPYRRDDAPVYYYIYMPAVAFPGPSPQMGFTRNLDVLMADGRWGTTPPVIKVNALWGWPVVPDDVKQATIWAVEDWLSTTASSAGPVTAHAIESFSESFGNRGSTTAILNALPQRSMDLLAAYMKIYV